MQQSQEEEEEKSQEQQQSEYMIYTKTGCPYCVRAKDLLASTRRSAIVQEVLCDAFLTSPLEKEAFLSEMAVLCGRSYRTFPMIFHWAHFVGGYSDLVQYLERESRLLCTEDAFTEEVFR